MKAAYSKEAIQIFVFYSLTGQTTEGAVSKRARRKRGIVLIFLKLKQLKCVIILIEASSRHHCRSWYSQLQLIVTATPLRKREPVTPILLSQPELLP